MNDVERDELLSTYIDGLASPQETNLIESDASLVARAAELREARSLVATPVTPPDPATIDATLAAALAESATASNVVSLGTARRSRSRNFAAVSAAAVIIAIGFLAGAVILNLNSDGNETDDVAAGIEDAEESTAADDGADTAETQLSEAEAVEEGSGEPEAAADLAPAPEAASEEAPEQDSDQSATGEAAPQEEAVESFDDSAADESALDESAEESSAGATEAGLAPTPEPFDDLDQLLAAIDEGDVTFHTETQALPCGVEPPEPRPDATPGVVLAELPEGLIVITGWTADSGFEVDQVLAVDLCPPSPLPTP